MSSDMSKSKKSVQVLCLSSGKGGVGKTLTTIHFALRAAELGRKVLILDGDFGLSNVDIVLGLKARYNISSILNSEISASEVLLEGPSGLKIIPGGSGISKLADLSQIERLALFEKLESVIEGFDLLLIDAGAGISPTVVHLNSLADWNVIVTNPEPHTITDAYAMVKVLKEEGACRTFSLLVNSCPSEEEAYRVYCRFSETARKFLGAEVAYAGRVPSDPSLYRQISSRSVGASQYVASISAQAWNRAFDTVTQGVHQRRDRSSEGVWRELVWNHQKTRQEELRVFKPKQSKELAG